ncbi:hypothetical protein [Streptomyces sp. NPDC001269]
MLPAIGDETGSEFDPASTGPQRQLAAALRQLCRLIPGTQTAICAELHIAKPTLTGYLKAARVPADGLITGIYGLAEHAAAASGGTPPMMRGELLELAAAARIRHCSCCARGAAGRHLQEPGIPVQAAVPDTAAAGTGTLPEADRHLNPKRAADPAIEGLARYVQAGRLADARTLMHYAGTGATTARIADFVSGSRDIGLHDAADTVLHHAARRDAAAVLDLAALLAADDRFDDVKVLLGAAAGGSS